MKRATTILTILALAMLTAFMPLAANADRGRGHGGHSGSRHHQVRIHNDWHHGHWRRGYHRDHLGWWWVVGSMWYLYPRMVYPYPDYRSSTVIVNPPAAHGGPPPAQHWYYCESSSNYYPYVSTCAEGWKRVPATPPQ